MNSRININNNAPTHSTANKWLTDLMIDLKKMVLLETEYQPFTLDRLNEWSSTHIKDYETCKDYVSLKYASLAAPDPIAEHVNAIMFFNAVIIDLKLMIAGVEHGAFDEARIVEADKHWHELVYCRKRPTIFY